VRFPRAYALGYRMPPSGLRSTMSRIYAYEREPYRTELDVAVLETGEDDGGPFAVLDDTILFPEGGGQPADHGRLAAAAVVDVRRRGDAVRHVLDAPVAAGKTTLALDWRRRYDHMQQHTAQHLVTATALRRFGWRTTAFHLRADACDVELDAPAVAAADLEALEDAVAAEVRAGRAVTARRVTPEEYARLDVRSRGLPAGHRGDVRLVEIAGVDVNTCGGTHLRSTAEIETVKLLGTEPMRGGTRLHWLAGSRVRGRLAAHEARAAELRRLLDTADDALVDVVSLKLAQLKDAARLRKRLEKELGEAVAASLAERAGPVVDAHFVDAGMDLLLRIAHRFSESPHTGLALLTAAGADGVVFIVAAGGGCRADVQAAGRQAASALGGRGGGSGRLFQGKADSAAGRGEALAALRAVLDA